MVLKLIVFYIKSVKNINDLFDFDNKIGGYKKESLKSLTNTPLNIKIRKQFIRYY
jgi:hypothetical protein